METPTADEPKIAVEKPTCEELIGCNLAALNFGRADQSGTPAIYEKPRSLLRARIAEWVYVQLEIGRSFRLYFLP